MTRSTWTLTDAKARFSAVVQRALDGMPQRVVRNGREAVIVVAESAYHAASRPRKSLVELFASIRGVDLEGAPRDDDREAPEF